MFQEEDRDLTSVGSRYIEEVSHLQVGIDESDSVDANSFSANNVIQRSAHDKKMQSTNDEPVELKKNEEDKFEYEGDWCVASEDLSEDDFYRAKKDRKEWLLSRGTVFIDIDTGDYNATGFNNEYIESYQEMDVQTLIEFGSKDDRMALITLVQLSDVRASARSDAAKKLVVLGDTAMGLQQLVMDELNSASFRFSERNGADAKVKEYLVEALALVEFRLERRDVSALNTYLMYTKNKDKFLNGLNPEHVLSDSDLSSIKERTRLYNEKIEGERTDKNLPSLKEQEIPQIANTIFNQELAFTYGEYGKLLNSGRIFSQWNNSYLQKNACVERLIARH